MHASTLDLTAWEVTASTVLHQFAKNHEDLVENNHEQKRYENDGCVVPEEFVGKE